VTVCQALKAAAHCSPTAPARVVTVDPAGRLTTQLTVKPTVGGANCRLTGRCVLLVPDAIWGRPTGRPVARTPITY
jgi:hypothetical protein